MRAVVRSAMLEGHSRRAAGDVEHPLRFRLCDVTDHLSPPAAVLAHREELREAVVARGQRGEELWANLSLSIAVCVRMGPFRAHPLAPSPRGASARYTEPLGAAAPVPAGAPLAARARRPLARAASASAAAAGEAQRITLRTPAPVASSGGTRSM